MMKIPVVSLIFIVSSLLSQTSLCAQEIVLFGTHEAGYVSDTLKLAMSKLEDKKYRVVNFSSLLPKVRAFEQMNLGEGIDVIFGGTTLEREANYRPIRFPILKGLNGWRVPLVHKEQSNLFDGISDLAQFQQFRPGLFHDWSDTLVMENNGITVIKASNYPALYNMLSRKRFDYFPRSVLEIDADYERFKHLDIAIYPKLLIYYPTAYYFFVGKNNESLAADIELGLNRAFADGSFDRLFFEHHAAMIDKYAQQPVVIRLNNPNLPDTAPLDRKELWIDLENYTRAPSE